MAGGLCKFVLVPAALLLRRCTALELRSKLLDAARGVDESLFTGVGRVRVHRHVADLHRGAGYLGAEPHGDALVRLHADDQRVVATARLQRLAPVADAASNARSYFAILLGNTTLIPGTAVSVLRPHVNASTGYWIPRAAFAVSEDLQRGTSAVLLVVENGRCAARTVWLGALASDQVEVRSGLMTGDQIVLTSSAGLKPGVGVTVNML